MTGAFGRDAQRSSRELLKRGLVHIIASDGHTAGGARDPILSVGVAAASRVVGKEAALRMVEDTPQSILQDEMIDTEIRSRSPGKIWWPFRR
jgi:protein-tyrosine phosphatase